MRMLVQLTSEAVEGAADQPGGTIGMAAGAPAVDLAEPPPQQADIRGTSVGQPLEPAGDRVEAEEARAALSRRLVGEVAYHCGGLPEPAGVIGQCRNQAAADAGAEVRQSGR
jgi:hypothetical protein